ncbi:MAG: DUF2235 domain-containing protein [Novosphingobium sp.]
MAGDGDHEGPGETTAPEEEGARRSDAEAECAPEPEPGAEAPSFEQLTRVPRNILLFSDGTGNSSGKLLKTNVWRLYEALDLGYPARDKADLQIAFYDDGVGTSSFRLLAVLGGVFGFGLANNLRNLYKFLCRNYRPPLRDPVTGEIVRPGDRIYAFGFSRGAYTIRLLAWLITSMGIREYHSEEQLHRDTLDTWREYRRGFHTSYGFTDFLVAIGRAISRCLVRAKRLLFREPGYARCLPDDMQRPGWLAEWFQYWCAHRLNRWALASWWPRWFANRRWVEPTADDSHGAEIEFVGVWDTVAAYGGPIVEITRAIDGWIWPLSMPDYRLSPKVKCARHALAIDDKRDAFHPLFWDEVLEAEMCQSGKVVPYQPIGDPVEADRLKKRGAQEHPRLQQVWFAGMHADVGGGYPDEALSYVSLGWMIEHAELAGVRLLKEFRERIFEVRNVFGPIHDSRGGAGAFYRYQPRYINAWIDKPNYDREKRVSYVRPGTQIYRDPTVDHGRYVNRGFLRSPILMHHSVEERLYAATDGYGPINLPTAYEIDDGIGGLEPPNAQSPGRLEDLYELGDRIKLRRFWYFLSVFVAVLIAIKPWWESIGWLRLLSGTVDARTQTQIFSALLNAVVPTFASRWIDEFTADPWTTLLLITILVAFTALGVSHERKMVDASRRLWRARFDEPRKANAKRTARVGVPGSWWFRWFKWTARAWRSASIWQDLLAKWKWQVIPLGLGLLLWGFTVYVALAGITQVALVAKEAHTGLCGAGSVASAALPADQPRRVALLRPCADLGIAVRPNTHYRVVIVTRDWHDGGHDATPEGWNDDGAWSSWATQGGSKFFRRLTSAPLFAPILETRVIDPQRAWWRRLLFGQNIYMHRIMFTRTSPNVWTGDFTSEAPRDGLKRRLYFFVNDAVLPVDWVGDRWLGDLRVFPLGGRYRNNQGTATISVRSVQQSAGGAEGS